MKVHKSFIRIMAMLLTMIFLSFIIGHTLTTIVPKKADTEAIRFRKQAGTILEKLVNSESCLAANEGEKIIDLNALEDFQSKYSDIEPDCARSYEYGYNIEVEMSGIKTWRFGSSTHSEYDALKGSVMLSTAVMIKDGDEIQPGKMTIKMYKGELEELVGLIDKTCDTGLEIVKNIHLSYPVEFMDSSVCMEEREGFCRKLSCKKVDFQGVSYPGNYTFLSKFEWGGDTVIVEATETV